MTPSPSRRSSGTFRPPVFVLLLVLEGSLGLIALAMFKKGDRSLPGFLTSGAGLYFVAGLASAAISSIGIAWWLRRNSPRWAGTLVAHLLVTLWTVALVAGASEVVIRWFTVATPGGEMFADTVLRPRSWAAIVERHRAFLDRAETEDAYLVFDDRLGWTIGPSRTSPSNNLDLARALLERRQDRARAGGVRLIAPRPTDDLESGLYVSSEEGLRSPRVGMRLADVPARHRVALVGDSFTFGLEVRYADTWGHRLDEALGPEVQVLNFGVDAYGVDQAYLRYRRDAASWQPDVVVLGVIDEDFRRSLGVYAFLGFPAWDIPFPKPRFTVTDGRLEPLNLPLPQPRSIFEADSVLDLPYVGHDVAFDAEEWRRRPLDRSYLVRFLLSRFPRWSAPSPSVSSEALATVNRELLRSFVASVARDGAVPLIVFFPTMAELADEEGTGNGPARTILRSADIPYLDMTDCVRQVPPSDRFVILHYSPESNAAVAECLSGAVRERLADR